MFFPPQQFALLLLLPNRENTPPLLPVDFAVEGETPAPGERGIFFPVFTANSSLAMAPSTVGISTDPEEKSMSPVELGSFIIFFSAPSCLLPLLLKMPANVDPTLRGFLSVILPIMSSEVASFDSSLLTAARALLVSEFAPTEST